MSSPAISNKRPSRGPLNGPCVLCLIRTLHAKRRNRLRHTLRLVEALLLPGPRPQRSGAPCALGQIICAFCNILHYCLLPQSYCVSPAHRRMPGPRANRESGESLLPDGLHRGQGSRAIGPLASQWAPWCELKQSADQCKASASGDGGSRLDPWAALALLPQESGTVSWHPHVRCPANPTARLAVPLAVQGYRQVLLIGYHYDRCLEKVCCQVNHHNYPYTIRSTPS